MVSRREQPENAPFPKEETVLDSPSLWTLVQLAKAPIPMLVTPSGKDRLVMPVHHQKAYLLIVDKLDGKLIEVMLGQ